MNLKRAFVLTVAAMIVPGMAFAQNELRIDTTTDFTDSNPNATVFVEKVCDDGLPLDSNETLGDGDGVVFVTTDLGDTFTCEVTAVFQGNYTPTYLSSGADTTVCVFTEADLGDGDSTCEISLDPAPATVTVTKEWDVTAGGGGNEVNTSSTIVASSSTDGVIVGAVACPAGYCLNLNYNGDGSRNFQVNTDYNGESITLVETINDSSVESSNSCGGSVTVFPGGSGSCAFTNTVFFEGIPTLSQYGLAIMALLMLGVGFVGFRRFV